MASEEENLKSTLRFLTLVFPEQEFNLDDPLLEQKMIKEIYVETLEENGIVPIDFVHAIKQLYKKGYVFYTHAFFDPKVRQDVVDIYEDEEKFGKLKKAIIEHYAQIEDKTKEVVGHQILSTLPPGMKFDDEIFTEEDTISIEDFFTKTKENVEMIKNGLVVRLVIVPYRNIHDLYKKLDDGLSIAQATAGELAYIHHRFELLVNGYLLSTKEKGEIPYYHYVLKELAKSGFRDEVFYSELDFFKEVPKDEQRGVREKFRKSCYGFKDKIQKKVPAFLIVTTKSVRVNPQYIK